MTIKPPAHHSTTSGQLDSEGQQLPSSIAQRQNEPANLRLLAAQRQLYSEAKTWQKVRTWSVLGVAALGVAATIFSPSLLVAMGVVGAATAIAQWVAMQFIRQRTKVAAAVQEQFDSVVLQLPWNSYLVKKPDPEVIVAADARHRGDCDSLINWYSVPAGTDVPYGVLLAQRTNVRWDSELRQIYANAILIGMMALLVLVTAVGMAKGLTLTEFVLALLPSVGAFFMGIETIRSHRQHASGQAELKMHIESTWGKATGNRRAVKQADLRAIQDQIYRFRTLSPPVPDWFYWRHRSRFETETKSAIDSIWRDVQVQGQSKGNQSQTRDP